MNVANPTNITPFLNSGQSPYTSPVSYPPFPHPTPSMSAPPGLYPFSIPSSSAPVPAPPAFHPPAPLSHIPPASMPIPPVRAPVLPFTSYIDLSSSDSDSDSDSDSECEPLPLPSLTMPPSLSVPPAIPPSIYYIPVIQYIPVISNSPISPITPQAMLPGHPFPHPFGFPSTSSPIPFLHGSPSFPPLPFHMTPISSMPSVNPTSLNPMLNPMLSSSLSRPNPLSFEQRNHLARILVRREQARRQRHMRRRIQKANFKKIVKRRKRAQQYDFSLIGQVGGRK